MPAGISNSIPPVAKKIPFLRDWKTPIDFGMEVRGKRILGQNKTWRGLLLGSIGGGLTAFLLYPALVSKNSTILTASPASFFLIGFLLGAGALLGDSVESFFKRQLGKPSGSSWLFFDQLDYVVGAILFSLPFVRFSFSQYVVMAVTYFSLHILISYVSFKMGIKEQPI